MQILPVFYGEKVIYYFSEEMDTGSITTPEQELTNMRLSVLENSEDSYFRLNNSFIYEHMFKYDQVEKIITEDINNVRMIKGVLI